MPNHMDSFLSVNLEVEDCFREESGQKPHTSGRGEWLEDLCSRMKEVEEVFLGKTLSHRE